MRHRQTGFTVTYCNVSWIYDSMHLWISFIPRFEDLKTDCVCEVPLIPDCPNMQSFRASILSYMRIRVSMREQFSTQDVNALSRLNMLLRACCTSSGSSDDQIMDRVVTLVKKFSSIDATKVINLHYTFICHNIDQRSWDIRNNSCGWCWYCYDPEVTIVVMSHMKLCSLVVCHGWFVCIGVSECSHAWHALWTSFDWVVELHYSWQLTWEKRFSNFFWLL